MNSSAPHHSSSRRAGFTLVELLVVIGIIAVLIGILLPTLNKARESAKASVCLSNLRQIGVAFNAYLADNKGFGFIINYPQNPPAEGYKLANRYWFAQYNYSPLSGFVASYDYSQGYLVPYFKSRNLTDCPSLFDESTFSSFVGQDFARIAYGFNGLATASSLRPNYVRFSQVRKPWETMALCDTAVFSTAAARPSTTYISGAPSPQSTGHPLGNIGNGGRTPSFHGRHNKSGNVLWYDGHCTAERPYISSLPENNDAIYAANNLWPQRIAMNNIGYLTPVTKNGDIAEADFMKPENTARVNYYYYLNKTKFDTK